MDNRTNTSPISGQLLIYFIIIGVTLISIPKTGMSYVVTRAMQLVDAYIYLNEQQIALMTDQTPEELMHRYTAVLYFEPFRSEYLTDGNEFRVEHEDEMAALEAKTRAIWQRHSNIIFIPTFETIEQRVEYTVHYKCVGSQ